MKAGFNLKIDYLLLPIFLLLTVLTAAHLLTRSAEFTGDDFYYIVNNPLVTTPGIASLLEIWHRAMKIEYFPLTITTYALEYRLWGGYAAGYHFTNLVIFAAIGSAAFSLARALMLRYYKAITAKGTVTLAAAAATLLLLMHPLNVESAASISNRKELLYVFFGLLSLNWYITGKGVSRVAAVLFFMVLAQLSKGTAVILPALFWSCELLMKNSSERKRFALPVVATVLAALIFAVQIRVAYRAGVIEKSLELDLLSRAGGIIRSFNMMLGKFFLPVNLSYDYDFIWPVSLPPAAECLLPLAVVGVTVYFLYRSAGWISGQLVLIVLTLIPYANFVPLHHNNSGQMVFYDHYLLFAIMLFVPFLAILIIKMESFSRKTAIAAGLLSLFGLCAYNFQLFSYWKDRVTLYSRIVSVTPTLPKGYLFLGKALIEKERHAEAVAVLRRLLALDNWFPTYLEVYRELGNAYAFSGRMTEAETSYRKYLEYQPKDRISLQNLSSVLIELHRYNDAKTVILAWMMHYPEDSGARYNLQLCEQMILRGS